MDRRGRKTRGKREENERREGEIEGIKRGISVRWSQPFRWLDFRDPALYLASGVGAALNNRAEGAGRRAKTGQKRG